MKTKINEFLNGINKDNILLIYNLVKNNTNIYFYLIANKSKIDAYLIIEEKDYIKKLMAKGYQWMLEQYLMSICDYCSSNWFPQKAKSKKEFFSCDFRLNDNNIYYFDIKSVKVAYNPFYECLNFLISISKIGDEYKVKPKYKKDDLLTRAKVLDNEIVNFVEKYATGHSFSFEKKLNQEWEKINYTKKCVELCKKMDNIQLIESFQNTQYFYSVGNYLEHLKPLNLDEILRNERAKKLNIFYYLNFFVQFIKNLDFDEEWEKEVFKKTEAFEQIDYILSVMSTKEIMFLFNSSNDWLLKLDYIKYLPQTFSDKK